MLRELILISDYKNLNGLIDAIMYEAEDLCVNETEYRVRSLLEWLNERGTPYTIHPKLHTAERGALLWTEYLLKIDDDETCVLIKMFHDTFEFVPLPEPEPEPEPEFIFDTSSLHDQAKVVIDQMGNMVFLDVDSITVNVEAEMKAKEEQAKAEAEAARKSAWAKSVSWVKRMRSNDPS